MAKLIYSTIASLDCFVEDRHGAFELFAPDDELFAFINECERPIGTYLYCRRMYEKMVYWETYDSGVDDSVVSGDFAEIWRAADKIVFSATMTEPSSERTTIEPAFDSEKVAQLKASSTHDLTIGGASIASYALSAGLVDEVQLFLSPIVVGGGKPAFSVDIPVRLELLEERRFTHGHTFLRYAVAR